MNLLSLRYFMEIAQTLNFTQASKNLHISQPGLSQQIHLLEEQLGVKLFLRTTRKVELTEEGKYLYEKLSPSFRLIENTVHRVVEGVTLPTMIQIATVPSAASLYLPQVLKKLHQMEPNVEVQIEETTSRQVLEKLRHKEVHMGFIRTTEDFSKDRPEGVHYLTFQQFPFRAVVSVDHQLAHREAIELQELKDSFFLHYDAIHSAALRQQVDDVCRQAGFVPQVICTGSELLTISNLIANNLGVTLMPTDMISLIDSPRIRTLMLKDPCPTSSISAVWEDHLYIRRNTQCLVEIVQQMKASPESYL